MIVGLVQLAALGLNPPSASEALPWYCDEAVVSGRAEVLSERDLSGPEDLLGHIERTYRIKVYAWLRGNTGPDAITASSTGHGQWRPDRNVMFFIVPQPDGTWKIRSGVRLRGGRILPMLEETCTPPPHGLVE